MTVSCQLGHEAEVVLRANQSHLELDRNFNNIEHSSESGRWGQDLPSRHPRQLRQGHAFLSMLALFGEQRIEQPAASGAASGEGRLQPVAKCHQLIELGDDAMLFGER